MEIQGWKLGITELSADLLHLLQCEPTNAHASLKSQRRFNKLKLLHVSSLNGPSSGSEQFHKSIVKTFFPPLQYVHSLMKKGVPLLIYILTNVS